MQYAFLVTSVIQFAGGVVVFFGLLTSPKEIGRDYVWGKESVVSLRIWFLNWNWNFLN